jgi:flagellar basal body L-ring protein FlgH
MLGWGGWEPAQARIEARRDSSKFAMGATAMQQQRYEYAVEITPGGVAQPFSTTMVTPLYTKRWRPLHVGDVVTVLWQPKTKKVKFDRSEPSTNRQVAWKAGEEARKRAEDEAFDAAVRGGPGYVSDQEKLAAEEAKLMEDL